MRTKASDIKPIKEFRKSIRDMDINELQSWFYKLRKEGIDLNVRRWNGWIFVDDLYVFDDGVITCYECPAWKRSFRNKTEFSYNIRYDKKSIQKIMRKKNDI